MDKQQFLNIENFISIWNSDFPNYTLKVGDLKKPQVVIGAFFQLFERLGVDRDAVLAPPPEEHRTENTVYYTDLLPFINMTRVINHLMPGLPSEDDFSSISHFLQPTTNSSHSLLMFLYNLMIFYDARLKDIEPHEEELFAKTEEVKILAEEKNKLLELLNEQSVEKCNRAQRIEMIENEIIQIEEDLKKEKELLDLNKQKSDAILKEIKQADMIVEQKKSHRDELMDEIDKKRALRVYDADDVNHKAEQAALKVQEAEEKLDSLRATLTEKENCVKNLQTVKPNLEAAITLLQEIGKLSENLKDFDSGDLESDGIEGEIDFLTTEASELKVQLSELEVNRAKVAKLRHENQLKRQQEIPALQSDLREAEENEKKKSEQTKKTRQRIEDIKQAIKVYEAEKMKALDELELVEQHFMDEIKVIEGLLINQVNEAEQTIEEKLKRRGA